MAAQSPVNTIENRLRRWQREVGWWDQGLDQPSSLPFAMRDDPTSPLTAAEDEEEDVLVTHYVDSVLEFGWPSEAIPNDQSLSVSAAGSDEAGDAEFLLEKGTHALVFAYSGEGKSACRVRYAKETINRRFLAVEYIEVGREKRTSQQHALAIIELIWSKLYAIGSRLKRELLALPVEPLQQLKELTKKLVPNHYPAIFVFVDDIEDNLGPAWSLDDVRNAIEPLFDPKLIQVDGLRFKLLIPRELARQVSGYPAVNSGRRYKFRPFRIIWTEARLRQCLEDRLRDVAVTSAPQSLGAIADDAFPFLDDTVITAALSMAGAPRNLFRLVHEMIISHVWRESDPTKYRLTPEDFERAKQHVLLARIESEKERQQELLQRRESQLDEARRAGDQQKIPQIAALLVQQHQETTKLVEDVRSLLQAGTLVEPATEELQEIRNQLLRIEARQEEVYTEIVGVRALVVHLPAELLDAYDEGNRVVVNTLLMTMTQLHLEGVRLTVQAIDEARFSHDEMQEAFEAIRSALQSVQTEIADLPAELRGALASLDTEIDKVPHIAHKLKLTIPFLVFLSYEIEIKQDLRARLASVREKIREAVRSKKERAG